MVDVYKYQDGKFVKVGEKEQWDDFHGSNYEEEFDKERLTGQIKRIFEFMKDGEWRTLDEISLATQDPPSSVSAQLRNLRKERFGGYEVKKKSRGKRENGLWEYRVIVDDGFDSTWKAINPYGETNDPSV